MVGVGIISTTTMGIDCNSDIRRYAGKPDRLVLGRKFGLIANQISRNAPEQRRVVSDAKNDWNGITEM